jgi:biopolymer transport protein TolR
MKSMPRSLRRSTELICRIDMTAFLSIQIVLLFTLMVVRTDHADLPRNVADLPRVGHAAPMQGADREDATLVVVQRDGAVWLGDQRISLDRLPGRIREAIRTGSERKVYIRADARARYSDVLRVLTEVRDAGVENVGFLVDGQINDRATVSNAFLAGQ